MLSLCYIGCLASSSSWPNTLGRPVLSYISNRRRQLEGTKDPQDQRLAKILDRKLEPLLQRLLMDDLLSGEISRRENAALLLGSLGRGSIPLLTEVIKKSEEFRVRQLAVSSLAQLGSEGAELLKRELLLGAGLRNAPGFWV